MKRLLAIQTELKCNKSQYNSFGKYNYRSCEDILEAVKPLLKQYGVCITLNSKLALHENGDAFINAVANLWDAETNALIASTEAFAMIDRTHKGMDLCQSSGCSDSYAKKYALSGLLLLDDCKDADTDENKIESEGNPGPKNAKKISDKQLKLLADLCAKTGKLEDVQDYYNVKNLAELSSKDGSEAIDTLMKYVEKGKKS